MENELRERLAERLKTLRTKAGYSQEEVANHIGKRDHTAYHRIETGKAELKLADAVKLSSLYGIELHQLVNATGELETVKKKVFPFTINLDGEVESLNEQLETAKKINELLSSNG